MRLEHRRVLVFSAHAADFCSRAGGVIARLVDAGSEVLIYDMTYGERCESPALWALTPPPSLEEIKAVRKREIEAAALVLGATIRCFDFGDSPLVIGPERRIQVTDAVRAFRPDLVLTHWINDLLHPDHVETTQAVLWASRYCDAPGVQTAHPPCDEPEVLCYETTLGTSPVSKFLPDLYVDITLAMDRKMEALRCLAAQPRLPANYEVLARYRALEAKVCAKMDCEFAEGFCRIVG